MHSSNKYDFMKFIIRKLGLQFWQFRHILEYLGIFKGASCITDISVYLSDFVLMGLRDVDDLVGVQQLLEISQLFYDIRPDLQSVGTIPTDLANSGEQFPIFSVVFYLGDEVDLPDNIGGSVAFKIWLHDLGQKLGAS